MQRNCGGVNADSHGTNALSCVGKFVREPNRTKRRGVKNAASPKRFPLSGGASFADSASETGLWECGPGYLRPKSHIPISGVVSMGRRNTRTKSQV